MNALRAGVVQLDQQEAVDAAEKFTIAAGHPGTATASSGTVTVVIQYRIRTEILGIVGWTPCRYRRRLPRSMSTA